MPEAHELPRRYKWRYDMASSGFSACGLAARGSLGAGLYSLNKLKTEHVELTCLRF